MYGFQQNDRLGELKDDLRTVARFEAWLRSRGYEPQRDPFMSAASESEERNAVQLVREYLDDRPTERIHWRALLRYASNIGQVYAIWGDSGCGLALVG